jgi:hypothetical protein
MPCTVQYTVEDIMREGPCLSYPTSRVCALWGDAESLSPFAIALLPIPIADRMWVLGRLLFRLSPPRACRVARLIALDVIELWDPPDIVVWFLGTGDEQARVASWAAAWDTAWAAARASAWDAAWDAARSNARASAWAAAWASAWAAAGASAWASSRSNAQASAWASDGDTAWAAYGASDALGPVRTASLKRYLSWVVKAFDPLTPVGGLL